ncbi:MAG: transposase [Verrucomicrobia bacterium]|nr:transposase [Prolixibacteraceae bacterium]
MREIKEFHRHDLPHYQQPGQAYFITWCLKDAIPAKAFKTYSERMEFLQARIEMNKKEKVEKSIIETLEQEFKTTRRKYMKAFDDMLDADRNPSVNLSKPANTSIIIESLNYWEGRKLHNCAYAIMNNHVHWVFETLEKDENGIPVYLEKIMHSVKRSSAYKINKQENRAGNLWQKESFDTTIRNQVHMYNAISYTLNNPVSAGLVSDWKLWPGTYYEFGEF